MQRAYKARPGRLLEPTKSPVRKTETKWVSDVCRVYYKYNSDAPRVLSHDYILKEGAIERRKYLPTVDPQPVPISQFLAIGRACVSRLRRGTTYLVGPTRDAYTFVNTVFESIYACWDLLQIAERYNKPIPNGKGLLYGFLRVTRPDFVGSPPLMAVRRAVGVFMRKQQQLL